MVTSSADTVGIPESHAISNLHGGHTRAKHLDDSDTLVAEHLVSLEVVFVCTAKTRVGGLNEDFVVLEGGRRLARNDAAFGRATENVVRNTHGGGFGDMILREKMDGSRLAKARCAL